MVAPSLRGSFFEMSTDVLLAARLVRRCGAKKPPV